MNQITIVGRIGQDAEIKVDNKLLTFSVATNKSYMKNNEWIKETSWHNIKFWGKDMTKRHHYFKKGVQVAVHGSLEYETWGEGDAKRTKAVVVAREAELLSKPEGFSSQPNDLPLRENRTIEGAGFPNEPIKENMADLTPGDFEDLPF